MAPQNVYPACPACPVAPEDGTGVSSGNPIGVESFLFHWGAALLLPFAPIPHPSSPLASSPASRDAPQAERSLCLMKLVLGLDVGRWSRILRAWNNCQESRFDPRFSILDEKGDNPSVNTTKLEAEIDQVVYEFYGLTEKEIKIVEGTSVKVGDGD